MTQTPVTREMIEAGMAACLTRSTPGNLSRIYSAMRELEPDAALPDPAAEDALRKALIEIREAVSKRQLPITNQVYEIADKALATRPVEHGNG